MFRRWLHSAMHTVISLAGCTELQTRCWTTRKPLLPTEWCCNVDSFALIFLFNHLKGCKEDEVKERSGITPGRNKLFGEMNFANKQQQIQSKQLSDITTSCFISYLITPTAHRPPRPCCESITLITLAVMQVATNGGQYDYDDRQSSQGLKSQRSMFSTL